MRRHLLNLAATLLLGGIVVGAMPPVASASIIVHLDSVTFIPSGTFAGDFRWRYSATATATDGFRSDTNVYFTIYDLPGTIVTVEAPANPDWGASGAPTGRTPSGLFPLDDPAIQNVTFEYKDPSERPGVDAFPTGTFDIILDTGTAVASVVAWQDYSAYPPPTGVLQSGLGTVEGVSTGPGPGTGVPAPGTLALLGLGLAGLAAVRRRKQ